MAAKINRAAIDRVIRKNLGKLRKPGVMTVRPGFEMTGGLMTDKPAIVATVDKKVKGLPPKDLLPGEVDNVPVDVREATGLQRLRQSDPEAHQIVVSHGRKEFAEPDWPFERNVSDGSLVPKTKRTPLNSKGTTQKKPEIDYSGPPGVQLAPVTRNMTIIANASPDAGYPVLTKFLAETAQRLTIAMYDFTSGDLLQAVTDTIKAKKLPFKMVLDHPPHQGKVDQTDEETHDDLLKADSNAQINWALTNRDPKAAEWIYPDAYHIKVAVRDSNSFWLSSGNFCVSNQPNLAANNPAKGSYAGADRDWHLVVLDEGLAKMYEAFIDNDFDVAAKYQAAGNPAVHAKIRAAVDKFAAAQARSTTAKAAPKPAKHSNFAAKTFMNVPVTMQPLLTPDKGQHTTLYVDKVLALIQSATRSLYMQTQYVHPSDAPADKDFMLLVQAFADAYAKGLDVRIITSQYENTPQWVEKMKEVGDLDRILRIQNRVHNKGIVVDSKVVLVSSQNWSTDGVLRNRDAGLIIEHEEIAQYFEQIFLYDWANLADVKLKDPAGPASKAKPAGKHTPAKPPKKKTAKKKPPKKRKTRGR
jgi:hypothetical protein